jgi:ssDNA-binding DdrB-like protein
MNTESNVVQKPEPDYIMKLVTILGQRLNAQNEILHLIAESLQSIEASVRQIALAALPAPNYTRPLAEYPSFDWASIGATILKEDSDGVAVVEWHGQTFTRRSVQNKYEPAVWFSRAAGKDETGQNRYVRLITFKAPPEAEPIPAKAKNRLRSP